MAHEHFRKILSMDNTINHELDEITFENSVSSLENLDKQITNNEDMLIF